MAGSFFPANQGSVLGDPVTIAHGGTGQTTANAALNALQVLALAQTSTTALSDNVTNTAPVAQVLKHTSSGTTAASFGIASAVDLQSAAGNVRRVLTDDTSLVVATDTAEEGRRNFQLMVSGALQKWGSFGYLVNGNNPMLLLGDPATPIGLCRVPGASAMQIIYSSAVMQFASGLVTSLTRHIFSARLQYGQGTTVASATTVTLGADGNVFPISGTTTINGIATASWTAGAVVRLKFAGILVVTHNSGAPGGGAVAIKTSTSANVTTTANSVMSLMYDGTFWVQLNTITPGY